MEFKLSDEELSIIADKIAAKLIQPEKPQSDRGLSDWIRADDLYSRSLFSRPTLNRYHKKGLIGKSTIGGTVCYYIPDILQLLKANYYKPEAIDRISDELRKSNEDKI